MNVRYLGEADEKQKNQLLRSAAAVIFPSGMEDPTWEEPFGRVIAEAGLCGTPVIAYDHGSSRDLIIQ